MDFQTYEKIQNQLKQQPGTTAAEICQRLDQNVQQFYAFRSKLKAGKKIGKPRKKKTPVTPEVFAVPTFPTRARVVVVQCWADELSDVLRGLS